MAEELAAYFADLFEMQHQYGCRSGRHIAALLSHLQHVTVCSHSKIVAIFLDIFGAYDRFGHDLLLETIKQFDVSPHIIEFTAEFLHNRGGSGMAQWLYVAVTQGPERRFEFSEG